MNLLDELKELRVLLKQVRPEKCCKGDIMVEHGKGESLVCSNDCKWQKIELILATAMIDAELTVPIQWSTAEYLAVLSGNVPWGNQKRRRKAIADLSNCMHTQMRPMSTSQECFKDATWDVSSKPKGAK